MQRSSTSSHDGGTGTKMSSSSNSTETPNISAKTHSILLSPKGTMYLLCESEKSIQPLFDLNIKVCDAYHEKNVEAYIDAKTNDKGEIKLYHYSSSNPGGVMIEWNKTHKGLETYVTKNFEDAIKTEHFPSSVKIDHISGTPRDSYFLIDRFAYMIFQYSSKSKWHLDFSTYVVSFCEKEGSSIELTVKHTCNEDEFISCCRKMNDGQFSNSSLKALTPEDICLEYELKQKNISKNSPLEEVSERSDVVRGKYMEFDAAIKTMDMAGVATKKKNIVLANVHDNICRWYGGETDDNGKFLFAFEFCPSNLYEFLTVPCNTNVPLTPILSGVVRGVFHLHKVGVGHGNITPWRVLLSKYNIPKLCGTGSCKPLNDELKGADIRSLGYLIAYCLSHPDFRSAITTEKQYKELKVLLFQLELAHEWDAHHLANSLVNHGRGFPSLLFILAHPAFWYPGKKMHFIKDVKDVLRGPSSYRLTKKIDSLTMYNNWKGKFPPDLRTYMEKQLPGSNGYDYTTPGACELIRFLRNLSTHRSEMCTKFTSKSPAQDWLKDEATLASSICCNFPKLVSRVHQELEIVKALLPGYYG